ESLRLLHPYIPFVTEEIYQKLPLADLVATRLADNKIITASTYNGMLINAPYPEVACERENAEVEARFEVLKDLIGKVRATKVDCGIDPAIKINIAVKIEKGSAAEVAREKVEMICLLAGVAKVDFVDAKPASSIGAVGKGFEAFVIVDENINKEQLLTRFQKAMEKEQGYAKMSENKLNGNFAQHAPAELVQAERDRLAESLKKAATYESYIKELQ
ncbi:MAG: class I tRNA ligase family protein, partial [Spirochaetia bacterium]|nr:class I tRNA ligase family protein [Spirochaetia bacterium]